MDGNHEDPYVDIDYSDDEKNGDNTKTDNHKQGYLTY
jgi:hypothetical protein